MKKTRLAVVLPALLVAGVTQAATVYQADDGSHVDVYGRSEERRVGKEC